MDVRVLALEHLHNDHKLWMEELEFVRDEIEIFEKELGDIVGLLEDKEMLAHVEHFQNQFIREKEVIDELIHDIREHEKEMAVHAKKGEDKDDAFHAKIHQLLSDRMLRFNELYNDLKRSYRKFMLRWLQTELQR